ncbi:synaptic vesicle 2-related protein-like [Sycon ciliatum]|uniref:synaptic vesicle 2-related protein-like n=1 Tax=Sycon ciliatum TaxID=27933 RepID=UPI0031F6801C
MRLTSGQEAMLSSLPMAGAALGGLVLGSLADALGRKAILVFAIVWTTYFSLLSIASPNFWWLLALRTLVGFGFGGKGLRQTWMLEMTPTIERARVFSLISISWALGNILEVAVVRMSVSIVDKHHVWQVATVLSVIPFLASLPLFLCVPESVRFLHLTKQKTRAKQVLHQISAQNGRLTSLQRADNLTAGTEQLVSLRPTTLMHGWRKRRRKNVAAEHGKTTSKCFLMAMNCFLAFSGSLLFLGSGILTEELLLWRKLATASNATAGTELQGGDYISFESNTPHDAVEKQTSCKDQFNVIDTNGDCHHLAAADYNMVVVVFVMEVPALLLLYFLADTHGRKLSLAASFIAAGISYAVAATCLKSLAEMMVVLVIARMSAVLVVQLASLYIIEAVPTQSRSRFLGGATFIYRLTGAAVAPVTLVLLRLSMAATLASVSAICLTTACVVLLLLIETKKRPMQDNWNEN